MSETILKPENASQLADIIRSLARVTPVGNQTKWSPVAADSQLVSTGAISGVSEYEPSEFTFTAGAGTRTDEIAAVLAERNQYLPFDPMLVSAGATLGGTVATGLSGPGRFRFGGVRDFLIGVDFVSGEGKLIRSGGKVVKNAAGFDIPKLLVGSLGRLGVMTSLTFKVFPKPLALQTLQIACSDDTQAIERIARAAASRWELDAIDYRPRERNVYLRLAGPDEVNQAIASEIVSVWGTDVSQPSSDNGFWQSITELTWAGDAMFMVKVPVIADQFSRLQKTFSGNDNLQSHVSAAANVMWIAINDQATLASAAQELAAANLQGLVVRGTWPTQLIGKTSPTKMSKAIQQAMDPATRFQP